MKGLGSRVSGIAMAGAAALVWIAASTGAMAGEAATKAGDAENLLAAGKVKEAVEAFDASAEAFWKGVPLTFRKALFADDVKGYGEYVAHKGSTFAPGSELKIYAEPVGFGSTPVGENRRIAFKSEIEIRNDKGVIYAKSPAPAELEKVSSSPSRDFHLTVGFRVPDLKPGMYKLILTVTDEATGKSAPIELPLTIG
ncbi:hypothetical protein [Kaistia algarum]|uniref:hypothetical protein n=1 Tax=Kaistia algarum TaxID=2083279 RepID=UPI001056F215|nr:hypothetical protein [Kaistia algarum]MCX5512464.1 hypothetical protein [Kaistia algarum]